MEAKQVLWEFSPEECSWKFPQFQSKERILVLGLGGSLDIVSAYAVAQVLASVSSAGASILYGGADLVADVTGWNHVTGCMYARPAPKKGSSRIEWILPQGIEGSPLLFRLPRLPSSSSVEDLCKANLAAFQCLTNLKLDGVVCVDVGGDVVTGGARTDIRQGQDWQVLNAVLQVLKVPTQLIVIGLGADGESSFDQLHQLLHKSRKAHALLGYRSLIEPQSSGVVFKRLVPSDAIGDVKTGDKTKKKKQASAAKLSKEVVPCPSGSVVSSNNEVTVPLDNVSCETLVEEKDELVQHNAKEIGFIVDNLRFVKSSGIKEMSACPNIIVTAIENKREEYVVVPRHTRPSLPVSWVAGLVAFDAQWTITQDSKKR